MEKIMTKIFDESWDDPLTAQVGGSHYKNLVIQPVEYITANNLSYLQGSVIKYVTRYKNKNGIEDLQKATHFIQMMIQEEENKK
jgi:hypothetical protein